MNLRRDMPSMKVQRIRGGKHGTFETGAPRTGIQGQKVVSNLCSYINVGIFFRWWGTAESVKGLGAIAA